ncbi:chemotaxis protein MotB [Enterobacter sp. BIGb0383]|uniref:flagellar motor protein MotB n=1 Tax=unclassified Enterobacter TaxID=2608935 RepID=UPI000F49D958|nr:MULTISPECIES: flagellar motor protein MotB [unclassified Enterobacter]ROP58313.1 chemotaxis protein MotB [Enterobacter sp. BIGb0383]ROS06799.1 chemotaxis protein MotB [Enterobacter sp. BIGb0359]
MSKNSHTTVVVRKKRKSKHAGHHGGSWKIAYADFMTAMMAFFLVMWLLSSSTPEAREQIAEYFKMPLSVALAHGDKSSLSDSVIPGGGADIIKQDGEVSRQTQEKRKNRGDEKLQNLRDKLRSLIKNDPRLSNFQSNLQLRLTDSGLLIQITDSNDRPMFRIGSREPEPYMRAILQALAPALNELPNRITLSGHTDSLPYAGGDAAYSNWELSADRANASRRALISGGLAADKFLRVIGMADGVSVDSTDHDNPLNRRITLLVHSKEKEAEILKEDALLNKLTATPETAKLKSELTIMSPDARVPGRSVKPLVTHPQQGEK